MKRQTLKKIIALFMAAVVIVVALPLNGLTKAVTSVEAYAIANNSPALPMVKDTKVNFNSVTVEFSDGYIGGDSLSWALNDAATTGIRLTSDGIIAYDKGAYLVTATKSDGVTSTEVVVVVAETADGPFNIFDFDFTNTTADEVNAVFGYQAFNTLTTADNGSSTVAASQLTADGFVHKAAVSGKGRALLYVKDASILGKFTNYTVSTTQKHAVGDYNGGGILARALLDADSGKINAERNQSLAVATVKFAAGNDTAMMIAGATQIQYPGNGAASTDFSYDVTADRFYDLSVEFSGNSFSIWLADKGETLSKVYDMSEDSAIATEVRNVRYKVRYGGTIGLIRSNADVTARNLTVAIPITSMPAATAVVEAYKINTDFPVLPLVKNKQVLLENLKVQLADGTYMYGNELNWAESTDYENVTIENGAIAVYATGGYLLKATVPATNEIVEVVVSVAETENGPFNIFEFDFTNTTADEVNAVFGYQAWNGTTLTSGSVTSSNITTEGFLNTAVGSASRAILYVKDASIISKFANYTLTTIQKHEAGNNHAGGVVGRALLVDGKLPSGEAKATAVSVMKSGTNDVVQMWDGSGRFQNSTAISTGFLISANTFHKMSVEFSGADYTVYMSDENGTPQRYFNLAEETTISDAQKKARYGVRYGTVGIFRSSANVTVKSFSVSIPVDTTKLPAMTIITTGNEITVLKNTVTNISQAFKDVDFAPYRDEIGEISEGNFVAYSEGTAVITDSATGKKYSVIVTTDADAVTNQGTEFAPEYITVIPSDSSDTLYTTAVSVATGKAIKNGVISVSENGTLLNYEKTMHTTDINANKYEFKVANPHLMTLSCELVDDSIAYINTLGATAHLPITNANYYGIKFVSRVSVIRADNDNGTTATAESILIDGTEYPVVSAGTVLLPTVLIPTGEELTVDTELASVVTTQTVSATTYKHSDISVKLTGIPENFLDTDVTARGFVKYNKGTEENPEYDYFYGEQMERSYNSVLKTAYPAIDNSSAKVDEIVVGGTNYALDGSATTNDISYKVGEKITFTLHIKGNYYIDSYTVYKDYADGETQAENTTVSGANISEVFKYTTTMEKAGVLTLKLRVFGKINDNLGATNQMVKLVVMSAVVNVEEINNDDYLADEKAVANYLTNAATTWDNSTEMSNLSATFDDVKEFLNSGGASFEVPKVIKLTKSDKSTAKYNVYEYIIATNAERGLETTNSDGYFEYAEFNERPATGYITVPVSGTAAATNGIYAFYMGWANAASSSLNYANATKICIYPNAHACLNGQSAEYYTNLASVSNEGYSATDYKWNNTTGKNDLASGAQPVTVGGKAVYGDYRFMFETDDDATSPDELFDYGVIKRDYFSLQLAKAVAPENSAMENYGGSMGGWQSVVMAAIETDVKKVTAVMPWKCTLGSDKDGLHINSTFMPSYSESRMYYNTVSAAKMISSDVEFIVLSGLGDETAPVIGAVALYNAADVTNKTMTLTQFQTHSGYQTSVLTQSTVTTK